MVLAEIQPVLRFIEGKQEEMIKNLGKIVAIPAMSPKIEGGTGESGKMEAIEGIVRDLGLKNAASVYERVDGEHLYEDDTGEHT